MAVIRDYRAEGWPSMDLCADELLAHLPADVQGIDFAPPFQHFLGRLPKLGGVGFNADRLLNRHLFLPQLVRRLAREADFLHIADHSYAHLALGFPAHRVGVYCHDLDAFRCLLEPARDPRPRWFRAIAARILAGLKRAAVVFYSTPQIGDELRQCRLVPEQRLVSAPYGVAAEFTDTSRTPEFLPAGVRAPFLLHIGGDMPRKRLDVLLDVFAAVRATRPDVQLVQVGPAWSTERQQQIIRLGIEGAVVKLTGLERDTLATLYRRAAAVLVPSEAEGFGLPVIEALACGAPVIATDIPVLREVGGSAAEYLPVADVAAWTAAVLSGLTKVTTLSSREQRLAQSRRYSWAEHAKVIVAGYRAHISFSRNTK